MTPQQQWPGQPRQQQPATRPAQPAAPQQAPAQQGPIYSGVSPQEQQREQDMGIASANLGLAQRREARQQAEFEAEQERRAREAARPQLTPAEEAVDREFASEYVDWTTGGFSDFEKQRDQLAGAVDRLESRSDLTGPVVGSMPDAVNTWINPEAINTREEVEEVVQRNLRLILGAQFTEREGERLIARAYNPRLDEATNARRVRRILQQMEAAAQAKNSAAEYYRENGTLAGWDGRLPRLSDFTDMDFEEVQDNEGAQTPTGNRGIDDYVRGDQPPRPEGTVINVGFEGLGPDGEPVPAGYIGEVFNEDGSPRGLWYRDSAGERQFIEDRARRTADRMDENAGELGAIGLAGHNAGFQLTDEGAGIGNALGAMLTGDFNVGQNYREGRDAEQYRVETARLNEGAMGTAAELLGAGGSIIGRGGSLMRAGRAVSAAGNPINRANVQSQLTRNALMEGGAVGGAFGFGSGRGLEESATNALVGTAAGAGFGAGMQSIGNRMSNRAAAQAFEPSRGGRVQAAADRLGIETIPAMTGGRGTRALTSGAQQGFVSGRPIEQAGQRITAQGGAARNAAADAAGAPADSADAGEMVRRAANVYSRRTANIGSKLYDRAERMAGGTRAPLTEAITTARRHMAELAESPTGAQSQLYKDLDSLVQAMEGGRFSISGIRAMRTELRDQMQLAGMRGSNSDRVMGDVVSAAQADIVNALNSSGNQRAAQALQTANDFWRRRVETIDEVLEPLLGKTSQRSGEQITTAVERLANPNSGDSARLRRLFAAMPEEEASTVRATLINRMGRPRSGSGEVIEGDSFSFATFLTNYNNMSERARALVFPKASRDALNDLAAVAEGAGRAGRAMNTSNTAGAIISQGAISTAPFWVLEPFTATATLGAQYGAGKLLASPRFARWLAGAPRTPSANAQRAYLSRLDAVARAEPAIASEVQAFQRAIAAAANDNSTALRSAVAEEEPQND